jgi:hypothetical protein
MLKSVFVLFCWAVIASTALAAQDAPAQKRMQRARWEGDVVRNSPDKSTLTVRKVGSSDERKVHYDSATRWVSQEHGSKNVNNIDPTQVKDGDRVIARGVWDNGVLYATLISKRLSHSQ